jgi:hypothetical protein
MQLFTVQPLEVLEILIKTDMYVPDFDKCYFLQDSGDRLAFERPYHWLTEQYNIKKRTNFSTPQVWWYTSAKEAKSAFDNYRQRHLLIKAEVPDNYILKHDADLWEMGPFMGVPLGYIMLDEYYKDDNHFDELWLAYKRNNIAMEETWKEIFTIERSRSVHQRLHATTPYIKIDWLKSTL